MSVFKVNLDSFGSDQPVDSLSYTTLANGLTPRTMYVAGPDRVNRILEDGSTFTDCNYYKRFCYPALPLDQSFLTLISDDGSEWEDGADFVPTYPKIYNLVVQTGGVGRVFASNQSATILLDTGSFTNFCQITNLTNVSVQVRLNGNTSAVLTLPSGNSQVFNANDLSVTLVEIDTSATSIGLTGTVQVICAVRSLSAS